MVNKRGSEIFLGVVGVATLLVAIIGATFAYFSASAKSANNAIDIHSATLSLGYSDVAHFKTNMIPTADSIAEYAAFNETWIDTDQKVTVITGKDSEGKDIKKEIQAPGQCFDQNRNEICSVYEFYIGNPNKTTRMEIEGSVNVITNEFENLMYAVYDELGNIVIEARKFPETGQSEKLTALNQALIGYEGVEAPEEFDIKDPKTYGQALDMSLEANKGKETNVRHYTMLIWIHETESLQEEQGKIFTAGISFTTGGATGGVTGIIAVADKAE